MTNVSKYSVSGGVGTLPAAPDIGLASGPTPDSFIANWTNPDGITDVFLEVATDTEFIERVAGFSNLRVTGSSKVVTGLETGVVYHFRVKAVGLFGISVYSTTRTTDAIEEPFLPDVPTFTVGPNPTATSVNIFWDAVPAATKYYIDVGLSGDATNVSNFVQPYQNYNAGNVTSINLTGLGIYTNNFIRIRAANFSHVSPSSLVSQAHTLPPVPVALEAGSVGAHNFIARWNKNVYADNTPAYALHVSVDDFATEVAGSPFAVGTQGGVTPLVYPVPGLLAGTSYTYKVVLDNLFADPPASNIISVVTQTAGLNMPIDEVSGSTITDTFNGITGTLTGTGITLQVGGFTGEVAFASTDGYVAIQPRDNYQSIDRLTFEMIFVLDELDRIHTLWIKEDDGTPLGPTYEYDCIVNADNTLQLNLYPGDGTVYSAVYDTSALLEVDAYYYFGTTVNLQDPSIIGVLCTPTVASVLSIVDTAGISLAALVTAGGINQTSVELELGGWQFNNPGADRNLKGRVAYFNIQTDNSIITSTEGLITRSLESVPTPTASAASSVTPTSFTANFDLSGLPGKLYVYAGINIVPAYNGSAISDPSQAVTGLTANTEYHYKVTATGTSGPTPFSNLVDIWTPPATPEATAATAVTSSSFTANFSLGGLNGSLYVYAGVDVVSGYNGLAIAGTSQSVTGLTANTAYTYKVKTTGGGWDSAFSGTVNTTTSPAVPSVSAATAVTSGGFTANFVLGTATGKLTVYDAGMNIVTGYNGSAISGTSQSVTGLTANAVYRYKVKAVGLAGDSLFSAQIDTATVPTTPTTSAATALTSSSFTANFSLGGLAGKLYVTTADLTPVAGYNPAAITAGATSYPVSGLNANVIYRYTVKSTGIGGDSAVSGSTDAVTLPGVPVANAATSITSTGFTANFSLSGLAGKLWVYNASMVALVGYDGAVLTAGSSSQAVTVPNSNAAYHYKVKTTGSFGESEFSNQIDLWSLPVTPTANAATAITIDGFTANFTLNGLPGWLYVYDNLGDVLPLYNGSPISGTSQAVSGLSTNAAYTYKVTAFGAGNDSAFSNTISTGTLPAAPTVSAGTALTTTGFTANYNLSPLTAGKLYVTNVSNAAVTSPNYNGIVISGSSHVVTGLNSNSTYHYKVKSTNAWGDSALSSQIDTGTLPAAPTASAATNITATGFTANFVLGGVTSYLYVYAADGVTPVTGYNGLLVTNTTQAVTVPTPNVAYHYKVQSVGNYGTSAFSATIDTGSAPVTPTVSAESSITETGFTANFNLSGLAGLLYVYDAGMIIVSGYNGTSITAGLTSFAVTGLTAGTVYNYKVVSIGTYGNSALSAAENVTTSSAPDASSGKAFFAGGNDGGSSWTTTTDALVFATNTVTMLTKGALSQARANLAGANSSLKAYFAGGSISGGANVTTTNALTFTTETTAQATRPALTQARNLLTGVNSSLKAYFSGGNTTVPVGTTSAITFSSDTSAQVTKPALGAARDSLGSTNSSTKGYFTGGWDTSDRTTRTDGFTYSSETMALLTNAALPAARSGLAGANSTTIGYYTGGGSGGSGLTTTSALTFSTETMSAATKGALSSGREWLAGANSPTFAYFSGGYNYTTNTNCLNFATDSTTMLLKGALSLARGGLAGAQGISGGAQIL